MIFKNLEKHIGKIQYLARFIGFFNKGYLVLMYHSVSNNRQNHLYNITIDKFKQQINYLSKHFQIVGIYDILQELKNDEPLHSLKIAITFDDGFSDNYNVVYPFLKKHCIPATFFIVTDFVNKKIEDRSYMSWKEIKEIASDDLFSIGSHAITHQFLTQLEIKEIEKEIRESKRILEENLDRQIDAISYPHSKYNESVIDIVRKSGYEIGFTGDRIITKNRNNLLKLGRHAITRDSKIKI